LLLIGPSIELQRTVYDFEKSAESVRNTSYPQANQFGERNILQPPTEEEMLKLFSHTEIK